MVKATQYVRWFETLNNRDVPLVGGKNASLGEMISTSQDYLILAPWLPVIPGVVIAVLVIGFSLFGDGIRDALEEGT